MKNRMLALARGRYGIPALAAVAFIESSVFPIPPDVMLIPMVLADRKRAWTLALVCTLGSVAGGLLGYAIGALAWDSIGQPLLAMYGKEEAFNTFKSWFETYGFWTVFGAGLTPFPYKVITIASGVTHINLAIFILASVLARGARFFLVAGALRILGARAEGLIEKHFALFVTGVFAVVVASFLLIKLIR